MKKIFTLALLAAASLAHAAADDPIVFQRDSVDNTTVNYNVSRPAANADGMFVYDGTNRTTVLRPFGAGFSVVGGAVVFTVPWCGTISQYVRGDGTCATLPSSSGTVTSVGLTSSNLTITGSPVTSSGTMSVSLPNVGTAGTYNASITTDSVGRVTGGTNRSFAYTTKTLNSCFQLSATRDTHVNYVVEISASLSLSGGQQGTAFLETFTDSSCTSGTQELARFTNGNSGTLTVGLGLTQVMSGALTGVIPSGAYARIRTQNNTGTPTFTSRPGQEVGL